MSNNQTIEICKNFFSVYMDKAGTHKKKTAAQVKERSKRRRERKKARRDGHKNEDKEECGSTVSDESLGTFCDRYEREQRTVTAHSVKVAEDPTPPSNLTVKEQYTPSSSLLQDPLMKDFKSYVATKNKLKRKWGMSIKPESL
ncbi:uncharacterized protein LOC144622755 isoform X1 [Crassostrea virginica]